MEAVRPNNNEPHHHLPDEVLVRVSQFLSLQQRARVACISRAWRAAAHVDAAHTQLAPSSSAAAAREVVNGNSCASLCHLGLQSEQKQTLAAVSPATALTRSAALAVHPATGTLLCRLHKLECAELSAAEPGLLLTAVSALQQSVAGLKLRLLNCSSGCASSKHGANGSSIGSDIDLWTREALTSIAQQLAASPCSTELHSLTLVCSGAAMFADDGAALAALGVLTGLTRLALCSSSSASSSRAATTTAVAAAPAPSIQQPPLGFGRPPPWLEQLTALREIELPLADSASAPIAGGFLGGTVACVESVALSLRADAGPRAVSALPLQLGAVTGLTQLAVNSFCFEVRGCVVRLQRAGCFCVYSTGRRESSNNIKQYQIIRPVPIPTHT